MPAPLILVVLATQGLFTTGDLMARANLRGEAFSSAILMRPWFLIYFAIRTVAMFGQLYVLSQAPVGRVLPLFSAASVVLVTGMGFLLLGEVLSVPVYVGVMLSVAALLVLGLLR